MQFADFSWILIVLLALVAVVLGWVIVRKRAKTGPVRPELEVPPAAKAPVPEGPDLSKALQKTRERWWAGLGRIVGLPAGNLAAAEWENLEETLLAADVSLSTAQKLLRGTKGRLEQGSGDLAGALTAEIAGLLGGVENGWEFPLQPRPYVISIVGVNGVGKTTTVGKLAYRFSQQGKKVLLGACDTFRAAAMDQLRIWSERAHCEFVSGREGADPGATAFDAVSAGKARDMDLVLLDTAGRLHTKSHLMDELKRVHKVVKKVIPEAPHQIWLVLDGTLGQNSLVQARQFHEALGLTGVIVTKLDGTAKGGAVLSVAADLELPLRFIGVGETASDLVPFQAAAFAGSLIH